MRRRIVFSENILQKHGDLPWKVIELYGKSLECFRAVDNILRGTNL